MHSPGCVKRDQEFSYSNCVPVQQAIAVATFSATFEKICQLLNNIGQILNNIGQLLNNIRQLLIPSGHTAHYLTFSQATHFHLARPRQSRNDKKQRRHKKPSFVLNHSSNWISFHWKKTLIVFDFTNQPTDLPKLDCGNVFSLSDIVKCRSLTLHSA